MDTFPDAFDLLKLNQEDINHLNRSIANNETEAVIKSLPGRSLGLDGFTAKFYQTFQNNSNHCFSKYSIK
jgi:hypothetical protein